MAALSLAGVCADPDGFAAISFLSVSGLLTLFQAMAA
jgi:hypothetical protein